LGRTTLIPGGFPKETFYQEDEESCKQKLHVTNNSLKINFGANCMGAKLIVAVDVSKMG
jgi:hypothetical protein